MRSCTDAALLVGVRPATLRQWVKRGHIPAPVGGLYDVGKIIEYFDTRPQKNFKRAVGSFERQRRVTLRE